MSLRGRLAIWYGVTAGGLVVLICMYSVALHGRTHYDDLDAMLTAMTAHVGAELARTSDPAVRERVLRGADHLGILARVDSARSPARGVSLGSGLPPVDPVALARGDGPVPYGHLARLLGAAASPPDSTSGFGLVQDSAANRWRVHARALSTGGWLTAALPLHHIDRSVESFGRLMLAMALLGSAGAFLVGWLVAGHALRPVAIMTDTAAAIAGSRKFTQRVPVARRADELGRLARTFNAMLASLEQAYAGQQRFIADASHELRAPLTLIQANLELAVRPATPPAEREMLVADAHAESRRLGRFVANLLALARADAGVPLSLTRVDLDRLLLDVLGDFRRAAPGHRLAVAGLDTVALKADADQLRQLLVILLDNAVKYTPPGGRIAIRLAQDDSTAILTIRDSGVGIAPEHLEHVFDRFYRADPGRGRDREGTGLGLAIARWIVEQHHGTITLESQLGAGTVALVTLPVT